MFNMTAFYHVIIAAIRADDSNSFDKQLIRYADFKLC